MRRGIAEERDLVRHLDSLGFATLRAPSSGSSTKTDRPDIVAGRGGLHFALEVKTTRKPILYAKRDSIEQLLRFAQRFGATPLLALKFKGSGQGWLLLDPHTLTPTRKGYRITLKEASARGVRPEALVSEKLTTYLEGEPQPR